MKTAAIVFSLYLLFKPLMPVVEYVAFYDYIKNELCVNKDVPDSHCNGKCHLKKQLAKATDTETGNETGRALTSEHSISFFQSVAIICLSSVLLKEQDLKMNYSYNKFYTFYYIPSFFVPPEV